MFLSKGCSKQKTVNYLQSNIITHLFLLHIVCIVLFVVIFFIIIVCEFSLLLVSMLKVILDF